MNTSVFRIQKNPTRCSNLSPSRHLRKLISFVVCIYIIKCFVFDNSVVWYIRPSFKVQLGKHICSIFEKSMCGWLYPWSASSISRVVQDAIFEPWCKFLVQSSSLCFFIHSLPSKTWVRQCWVPQFSAWNARMAVYVICL